MTKQKRLGGPRQSDSAKQGSGSPLLGLESVLDEAGSALAMNLGGITGGGLFGEVGLKDISGLRFVDAGQSGGGGGGGGGRSKNGWVTLEDSLEETPLLEGSLPYQVLLTQEQIRRVEAYVEKPSQSAGVGQGAFQGNLGGGGGSPRGTESRN